VDALSDGAQSSGRLKKEMPNSPYATDLTNAAWDLIAPLVPAALPGGRQRTTDIRAVLNAIFYLLRTGCQWRLLPREFPVWGTVYHYFRWKNSSVWTALQTGAGKFRPLRTTSP
jgi:putative transposase